jgi:hypothetical protein
MQMFKAFLPYGGCAEPVPAAYERTPTPGDRGLAIAAYLHRQCAARRSDDEPVDLGECRLGLALYQRQDDPSNDLSTRNHSKKSSFTRTSTEGGGGRELEDDEAAAEQR